MGPVRLALAALLAAVAVWVPARAEAPDGPVRLGALLGAAGAVDLDGQRWQADALEGRLVFVDAWATWCAPCLADLPMLRRLHAAHADRLTILGVSYDTMPRRELVAWLRRHDVRWPQLFDGRGAAGALARRLAIDAVPATFLFDREGRLLARDLRAAGVAAVLAAEAARPPSVDP